jgi:MFS family permease
MDIVSARWIPVFYALAMGSSGLGSLIFGRIFDQKGLVILVPLTVVTTLFAPLAFLGGSWVVLVGCAMWGLGIGVHESIVAAAVSTMVPPRNDHSLPALIAFSVVAELAAIPFFLVVARLQAACQPARR